MADHTPVGCDISVAECLHDLRVQLAEFSGVDLLSEHPGDLGHEVRGMREVSRPDPVARHGRVLRGHRVDGQPVAVGRARTDQVLGSALLIADPALHRVVVLRQDFLVAVVPVNLPRTDHTGIGPCRIAELMRAVFAENIGRHVRIRAVGTLAVAQVLQPFAEEIPDIVVKSRGADEDLRVAGPTETLVALRTIGGDVEEVAAQTPTDVAIEVVEQRVRAAELSGRSHVRVQDEGSQQLGGRCLAQARDLDIAESVESKPRRPFFGSPTPTDIGVGRAGQAQVFAVDGPVGVEHLGELERDLLSAPAAHREPADPGEVLSEIEDIFAGLRLGDLTRLEGLGDAHRCVDLRDEFAAVFGEKIRRAPTGLRRSRHAPVPEIPTRVVGLPVIDVRRNDRAVTHLPTASRGHAHLASVVQFDVQARKNLRMGPVMITLVFPEQRAGIPPVAEDRAEGVVARTEHGGHIGAHHLRAFPEI